MKPIAAHAHRVPVTKLTHNHTRSAAPHNRPCFCFLFLSCTVLTMWLSISSVKRGKMKLFSRCCKLENREARQVLGAANMPGRPRRREQGHIKRNFGPAIAANQTDFLNHRVHIVFDPKIWFVIYCLPQSAIFFVVAEILLHFAALWVGSLGIGRRGGGGRRGVALALSGLGQPKPRRSVSALLLWVQFRVNGNSSSDVRLTVISILLPIFCLISSFDFRDINHQCDDTYGINSC